MVDDTTARQRHECAARQTATPRQDNDNNQPTNQPKEGRKEGRKRSNERSDCKKAQANTLPWTVSVVGSVCLRRSLLLFLGRQTATTSLTHSPTHTLTHSLRQSATASSSSLNVGGGVVLYLNQSFCVSAWQSAESSRFGAAAIMPIS